MLQTTLRSASSLARRARRLSSSAASRQSPTPTSLWRGVPNVDASRCFDPLVSEEDLQVLTDVLTEEEEMVVADECMKILKRRRYEENHWDSVIVKFKEMERSRWSPETARVLERLREAPILPKGLEYFPAVHVIELHPEGYIGAHVDSIKFSGRVVAGVNLLSPSIMRFKEEHGDSLLEAFLPRRSMYMMTGRVRYHYTHEILPGTQKFRGEVPVDRTHRVSIMIRDVFLPEHLDKYGVPQPDVNPVDGSGGKRY